VILELRAGTAAAKAAEEGEAGLRVGDRVLTVDGVALNGRILTEVRPLRCALLSSPLSLPTPSLSLSPHR